METVERSVVGAGWEEGSRKGMNTEDCRAFCNGGYTSLPIPLNQQNVQHQE